MWRFAFYLRKLDKVRQAIQAYFRRDADMELPKTIYVASADTEGEDAPLDAFNDLSGMAAFDGAKVGIYGQRATATVRVNAQGGVTLEDVKPTPGFAG